MNKPVILSLGAMACVLLVFAVPAFNTMERDRVAQGNTASSDPVSGKHWQCVTQNGPDAPNLIVLRDNGGFMKLIDHSEAIDNGTNYDLQGSFDIKQDQLLAHIRKPSGEVVTDAYTVKHVAAGKMQMTHAVKNPENTAAEDTLYSCSMLASRS
jgi:hypothetical protein